MLTVEIVICSVRIAEVLCYNQVLNHTYVVTSVERPNGLIEPREKPGSD